MEKHVEREAVIRDTLHDFSIEYVKALAEVFGWRVVTAPANAPGPDVVIENAVGEKAVMFIESEVGHDTGSSQKYFKKLSERLRPLVEEYRARGVGYFALVIIANAPRRLTKYLRENRKELEEALGFKLEEGITAFVIPVLLVKEVLPAVFVRALGVAARLAPG